ncbi:MAG: FtsX-like permease family protein [Hymenobacter sp.]
MQVELGITLDNRLAPLRLLYPRQEPGRKTLSINPEKAFNEEPILAGGVFHIEQGLDDSYLFVPLSFAQRLLSYGPRRTALYVQVGDSFQIDKVKEALRERLGQRFAVLDSDEQHVSLLKAIKIEKLFVFITFAFILLIASLNIFFSLSMLVIDKRKDIAVLQAMGATEQLIRRSFLLVGAIVALVGAVVGLVLGVADLLGAADVSRREHGHGHERRGLVPGEDAGQRHFLYLAGYHFDNAGRVHSPGAERGPDENSGESVS